MKWVLGCLCLFAFSCKNKQQTKVEGRDILVAKFFEMDTISGLVDSQDYHFQMFLAYYRNDTTHIAQWVKDRQFAISENMRRHTDIVDSTLSKLSLKNDTTFDEIYQIDYARAFCEDAISISIGIQRSNKDTIPDNVFMITVVISENATYKRKSPTKSIEKIARKKLSQAEWDTIRKDIRYCDLWGLQSDNYESGCDGSELFIFGKKRRIASEAIYDKKYIYRWAAESTAVGKLLKDVYKISGMKVDCFYNL